MEEGDWEAEKQRREEILHCHVCDSKNSWTCECAQKQYEERKMKEANLAAFYKECGTSAEIECFKQRNAEQIWQSFTKSGLAEQCQSECAGCGGTNMFTCECAKATFMSFQIKRV